MNKSSKILILGGNGLVGSAIKEELLKSGYENILTPSRKELNLLNQSETISYFQKESPEYVFDAAAKVGGIYANNKYRADFIFENLSIQNNTFEGAFKANVSKLLFLGSSCIYPKNCPQPIKEEYLLSGKLEETNEPYAIAKIAGLKLAENFRRQYGKMYFSVMPTNLYGLNDNFHSKNSHVIPGLIKRMHETIENGSKTFEVWGTGTPKREFLFVNDLASACIHLMESDQDLPYHINVGTGEDLMIKDLAKLIGDIMGYKGDFNFNTDFPDGTPRKVLDVSRINTLGWSPKFDLESGLRLVINHFKKNAHAVRQG